MNDRNSSSPDSNPLLDFSDLPLFDQILLGR